MLKKTTVYLSESDMQLLHKRAAVQRITVAEAIRLSIQSACKPSNKQEKILWDSLDKIWSKTSALEAKQIDLAVDEAVKEVRGGKKHRRRS